MTVQNRLDLINTANRRGLVLGLTLSEVMMIILFALLLLFGAAFSEQDEDKKKIEELQAKATEGAAAISLLEPIREVLESVNIKPEQIDDILREMELARKLREEIGHLRDEASALAEMDSEAKDQINRLKEDLERKQRELAHAEKNISDLQQELKAQAVKQNYTSKLAAAMAEAGMTPEQVTNAEDSLREMKTVMEDLKKRIGTGKDSSQIEATLQQAAKDWANTSMDNRTLAEQGKYWKTKYESDIGNGKKYASPCWATNGVVDPIYDVSLTDNGMIMRRVSVPQWAEDYERLPTEAIKLKEQVSQSEFVSETRPLFNYSNKKDCRFFVRLFDDTSVNAKITYQTRRRAVEGHFYIIDMKTTRFSDGG